MKANREAPTLDFRDKRTQGSLNKPTTVGALAANFRPSQGGLEASGKAWNGLWDACGWDSFGCRDGRCCGTCCGRLSASNVHALNSMRAGLNVSVRFNHPQAEVAELLVRARAHNTRAVEEAEAALAAKEMTVEEAKERRDRRGPGWPWPQLSPGCDPRSAATRVPAPRPAGWCACATRSSTTSRRCGV